MENETKREAYGNYQPRRGSANVRLERGIRERKRETEKDSGKAPDTVFPVCLV